MLARNRSRVLVLAYLVMLISPGAFSQQVPDPLRTFEYFAITPGVPNGSFMGGPTNNFEQTLAHYSIAPSGLFDHNLLVQGTTSNDLDLSQSLRQAFGIGTQKVRFTGLDDYGDFVGASQTGFGSCKLLSVN